MYNFIFIFINNKIYIFTYEKPEKTYEHKDSIALLFKPFPG